MAKLYLLIAMLCCSVSLVPAQDKLRLDTATMQGVMRELQTPDGAAIQYRAYERLYYVANVEDSAYQYLNIYIPVNLSAQPVPVFLRTYVGGYMAARAGTPSLRDATGRAIAEGYAVVIPGSRGLNSTVRHADGKLVFTGKAPAGILDLKSAVRYLRHNATQLHIDPERIVTDGTSAGGAMSSLLGATGNHPDYAPLLATMGAADERDDVWAAVCFCPIIDLEHADMAYEWLYGEVSKDVRGLSDIDRQQSADLAQQYPDYLASLRLFDQDKQPLTASNYLNYLRSHLIRAAQKFIDKGASLPAEAGFVVNGSTVADLDMPHYLRYVAQRTHLKTPPAFDGWDDTTRPTPENQVFGNADGTPAHFTAYTLHAEPDKLLAQRIRMLNPMPYIGDDHSTTAPYWYIRHGSYDRDTAFPVPLNLYTRLCMQGLSPDFDFTYGRPHSGDYDLDELFDWLAHLPTP